MQSQTNKTKMSCQALVLALFLGQCLLIQGAQVVEVREVNCPCQKNCTCDPIRRTCPNDFRLSISGLKCNDVNQCIECDDKCQHFCNNIIGNYTCNCKHGFRLDPTGYTCTDIDECQSGRHGCTQICKNTYGSYECDCKPGFTLAADGYRCIDIDECAESDPSEICPPKSDCWNTLGSYDCICKPGYTGCSGHDHNCICRNINECATNNGQCEQSCTDTDGSYNCSCNVPSYRLANDHHRCDDIDECAEGTHRCQQQCHNTIGSYSCSCDPGYILDSDGYTCNDIDECTAKCGKKCDQICTNTVGSYFCSCREGCLDNDLHTCTVCPPPPVPIEINECEDNNGGCAKDCYYNKNGTKFETCVDIIGSYYCRCPPGYRLGTDNQKCIDVNECEEGFPCGKRGNCNNTNGSYNCSCPNNTNPVYNNDSEIIRCNDINECDLERHNCDRKCENTFGSFACYCCDQHEKCDSDHNKPSRSTRDCLCPGIDPPLNLAFKDIGKTSIKISWEPPQVQGSAVERYTLVYRDPYDEPQYGVQVELPGIINSYTANELDPGTEYEFCITAKTTDDPGETPFNCNSTTTIEDVPKSPPRNITCTSVGPDRFNIAWMEPERPSGVITDYTLYIYCLDQNDTIINKTYIHSVHLTSLIFTAICGHDKTVMNKTVMIQMSANTSVGEGVKSGYVAFNTTVKKGTNDIAPRCPHGSFTDITGCAPYNDGIKFTCGVEPSPCQSDLPPLNNGAITYDKGSSDNRPIGTVATHTCDNGFTLTGKNIKICQLNGTWNESASAPTCEINTCPDLQLDNGDISYTAESPGKRPVGTVATHTCDNGYIFNGINGTNRICQSGGKWSGSAPTCDLPRRCQCGPGLRLSTGCNCVDVNECAEEPCGHDQICTNTDGSYECKCRIGYHFVRDTCEDIDECAQDTHNCANKEDCYNTKGSFLCYPVIWI